MAWELNEAMGVRPGTVGSIFGAHGDFGCIYKQFCSLIWDIIPLICTVSEASGGDVPGTGDKQQQFYMSGSMRQSRLGVN
jgi:hypothetical protein